MSTPAPEQPAPLGPAGLPVTAPAQVAAVVAEQQAATAVVAGAAAATLLGLWASVDPGDPFTSWFSGTGETAFVVLADAQETAAATARGYVVDVLGAQGIVPRAPGSNPLRYAGIASDGRSLESLLLGPVAVTQQALNRREPPPRALARGAELLARIAQVQVADAAREATQAVLTGTDALPVDLPEDLEEWSSEDFVRDIYRLVDEEVLAAERVLADVRRIVDRAASTIAEESQAPRRRPARLRGQRVEAPTIGWIRVLTPPSCGRCAVLAGRFYGWNEGFQRHDHCDCVHLPTTVAASRGLTVNPQEYFESLTSAQQDDLFGEATAQAIRDGADLSRTVNAARKGSMFTVDGRRYTREGTTRRGFYGDTEGGQAGALRPVPAELYRAAGGDREEARRLLRRFGYIT